MNKLMAVVVGLRTGYCKLISPSIAVVDESVWIDPRCASMTLGFESQRTYLENHLPNVNRG